MPRVSKNRIQKNIEGEIWNYFVVLASSFTSKDEAEVFFSTFFTPEEKNMFAKRLMIYIMNENRYRPFEITQVLKMSKDTVRLHTMVWQGATDTYKKRIKDLARQEKMKVFLDKVQKSLKPVGLFLRAKTDIKARAQLLSGPDIDNA